MIVTDKTRKAAEFFCIGSTASIFFGKNLTYFFS